MYVCEYAEVINDFIDFLYQTTYNRTEFSSFSTLTKEVQKTDLNKI